MLTAEHRLLDLGGCPGEGLPQLSEIMLIREVADDHHAAYAAARHVGVADPELPIAGYLVDERLMSRRELLLGEIQLQAEIEDGELRRNRQFEIFALAEPVRHLGGELHL